MWGKRERTLAGVRHSVHGRLRGLAFLAAVSFRQQFCLFDIRELTINP